MAQRNLGSQESTPRPFPFARSENWWLLVHLSFPPKGGCFTLRPVGAVSPLSPHFVFAEKGGQSGGRTSLNPQTGNAHTFWKKKKKPRHPVSQGPDGNFQVIASDANCGAPTLGRRGSGWRPLPTPVGFSMGVGSVQGGPGDTWSPEPIS